MIDIKIINYKLKLLFHNNLNYELREITIVI